MRLRGLFVTALAVALSLPAAFIVPSRGLARSVDDITQDINRLSQQASSLDAQISALQQQIDAKQSQINSLNNEVALLQQEIDQLQLQVESTQTKIDKTNAEIEKTQIEIRATEHRIEDAKHQLGALIRLLSQLDDTNPFEVLLANKSFSDLLDQVQYTERVQQQTQSRLDEIQQLRTKLDIDKHNLDVQLNESMQLKTQLQGQQNGLEQKKNEKADLLDKTKGEETNYQKLLKTNGEQLKKIQEEINSAQDELAKSTGFTGTPPPLGSGIFIKPVNGVETQPFGVCQLAGDCPHTGIDFAGPLGSPVFAAASGVVLAKGSMSCAYGNWIFIQHEAYGVATFYGHLISLPSIAVGTTVKQGDVIANEGSTGFSTGPHVHFGVGANAKTVNSSCGVLPVANWVDPAPYLAL